MTIINISTRMRFVEPDGTLTPAAYRALFEMLERNGGALGSAGGETFVASDSSASDVQSVLLGDTFAETAVPSVAGDMTAQVASVEALGEMVMQPTDASISVPSGALLGGLAGTLQPVAIGSGLSLLGGTLSATGGNTITALAGEAIGGHRAVVLDATGAAFYASNTNAAHLVRLYGITMNAASSGGELSIAQTGIVLEPSWSWTALQPVYLSTAGLLTQTLPVAGFVQIVGVALSATTLFINQRDPVVII